MTNEEKKLCNDLVNKYEQFTVFITKNENTLIDKNTMVREDLNIDLTEEKIEKLVVYPWVWAQKLNVKKLSKY
ncbi:MAG TPA: hypothetical protein GX708_19195 [Gallicola sp.]|nr:hypothetical protein [Gallicola sp.]